MLNPSSLNLPHDLLPSLSFLSLPWLASQPPQLFSDSSSVHLPLFAFALVCLDLRILASAWTRYSFICFSLFFSGLEGWSALGRRTEGVTKEINEGRCSNASRRSLSFFVLFPLGRVHFFLISPFAFIRRLELIYHVPLLI